MHRMRCVFQVPQDQWFGVGPGKVTRDYKPRGRGTAHEQKMQERISKEMLLLMSTLQVVADFVPEHLVAVAKGYYRCVVRMPAAVCVLVLHAHTCTHMHVIDVQSCVISMTSPRACAHQVSDEGHA